jgi:ABC-type glycerol-3-phosphate transport system permease component
VVLQQLLVTPTTVLTVLFCSMAGYAFAKIRSLADGSSSPWSSPG